MLHHRDAELLVELLRRLVYNNLGAPNVSPKPPEKHASEEILDCLKNIVGGVSKLVYNMDTREFEARDQHDKVVYSWHAEGYTKASPKPKPILLKERLHAEGYTKASPKPKPKLLKERLEEKKSTRIAVRYARNVMSDISSYLWTLESGEVFSDYNETPSDFWEYIAATARRLEAFAVSQRDLESL